MGLIPGVLWGVSAGAVAVNAMGAKPNRAITNAKVIRLEIRDFKFILLLPAVVPAMKR